MLKFLWNAISFIPKCVLWVVPGVFGFVWNPFTYSKKKYQEYVVAEVGANFGVPFKKISKDMKTLMKYQMEEGVANLFRNFFSDEASSGFISELMEDQVNKSCCEQYPSFRIIVPRRIFNQVKEKRNLNLCIIEAIPHESVILAKKTIALQEQVIPLLIDGHKKNGLVHKCNGVYDKEPRYVSVLGRCMSCGEYLVPLPENLSGEIETFVEGNFPNLHVTFLEKLILAESSKGEQNARE